MADEPTPPAAAPAAAASKPKMLIVIAAIAGGLVLGGAGGMFLLGPKFAAKAGYAATTDSTAEGDGEKSADHGKGEHDKGGSTEAALHVVDNLVLNPSRSGGTRFLMAAVAMELRDDKVGEEMTRRDAELRDTILRILGEKSVDQLSEIPTRDELKKAILDTVIVRFGKGSVKRVFFPQFVIQ